jgi:hypothetical protein
MSSKSKRRQPQITMRMATRGALTMFLWAYCQVHDPDTEQMEAMSREIQSVQDGLETGRLRLRDIEQALEDERGWRIL